MIACHFLSSNGTFINGEKIGMCPSALHCGCALSAFMERMFYACVNVHVGRNQKRVLNHDDEISLATKKNKGWYLQSML